MPKAISKSEEILVVIRTKSNEIFCGWTTDADSERIKLRNARQAIYFSADTHGLLGLAASGPARGSRIGPVANIECRNVEIVIECSAAAAETWEKAKWSE